MCIASVESMRDDFYHVLHQETFNHHNYFSPDAYFSRTSLLNRETVITIPFKMDKDSFKGCRLIAVDGSEIKSCLTQDNAVTLGGSKKGGKRSYYHLNASYDVLRKAANAPTIISMLPMTSSTTCLRMP